MRQDSKTAYQPEHKSLLTDVSVVVGSGSKIGMQQWWLNKTPYNSARMQCTCIHTSTRTNKRQWNTNPTGADTEVQKSVLFTITNDLKAPINPPIDETSFTFDTGASSWRLPTYKRDPLNDLWQPPAVHTNRDSTLVLPWYQLPRIWPDSAQPVQAR